MCPFSISNTLLSDQILFFRYIRIVLNFTLVDINIYICGGILKGRRLNGSGALDFMWIRTGEVKKK